MQHASCRNLSKSQKDNFFADSRAKQNAAKRVCASCAVRTPCYAFALEQGEHGVWGGTSDDERRRDRRFERLFVVTATAPDTSHNFAAFAAALDSL